MISGTPPAAAATADKGQPQDLLLNWRAKQNTLVVVGGDCIATEINFDKNNEEVVKITVRKAPPPGVYPQVLREVPGQTAKGSYLKISFRARSKEDLPVTVVFGEKSPPYTSYFRAPVVLSPQWQDYALVFKASEDFEAGRNNLSFQMPNYKGEIEISRMALCDYGVEPVQIPQETNRFNNPFAGKILTPTFYDDADAAIEKIRKGDLKIKVIGQSGTAVPNAVINIKQTRHKFRFGSAISSTMLSGSGEDSTKYKRLFLELFNTATPENDLKWQAVDWNLPMTAKQLLDWCQRNNLNVRGHNLLAPQKFSIPKAMVELNSEELSKQIEAHIKTYAKNFRGKVYVWDVLNEAVSDSSAVGGIDSPILGKAYKWVHEIDPDALLAYNDFDILDYDNIRADGKAERVKAFLLSLLNRQAPVSAIGLQSHMNIPLIRGQEIHRQLDRFAAIGLPIEITEYDLPMPDDKLQSDYLKEFMTATFSHPAVKTFVMWGFWQPAQFLGKEGGSLVRDDWSERPALATYRNLVFKKWWSNLETRTDERGESIARVFLGEHEVEVRAGGKSIKQSVSVNSNTTPTPVLICVPEL